jgi:hypothetical protein
MRETSQDLSGRPVGGRGEPPSSGTPSVETRSPSTRRIAHPGHEITSAAASETLGGHRRRPRSGLWLVVTAFVCVAAAHFGGEKIQFGDGLGYDGITYGKLAKDFYAKVVTRKVDDYYIQRVLPSAIVHYGLRLLHYDLTNAQIIKGFTALNVAVLTAAAWVWCLIATELGIGTRGRWLGLVCSLGNFMALKWSAYYPVTTDATAYLNGMLMLYFYLKGWRGGVYLATLLGAFTWPTAMFVGGLFLLFPRENSADGVPAGLSRRGRAALMAATITFGLAFALYVLYLRRFVIPWRASQPFRPLIPISVVVAILYACPGLFTLLNFDGVLRPSYWARRTFTRNGLATLAFLAGLKAVHAVASRGHLPYDFGWRLAYTAVTAVSVPGVFFVAHVVFYGPVILLALFLWRPTCQLIHEHGVGLTLNAALGLILSLCSESRGVINFFPLLVPFVIKATDSLPWRARHYGLVVLATLVSSRIWLTINQGPFIGEPLRFPDQLLFMCVGPWMSYGMYVAQGAITLLAGVLLYLACVRPAYAGERAVVGEMLRPRNKVARGAALR